MDDEELDQLRSLLTMYRSHFVAPDDAKTDRQVVALIAHVKQSIETWKQWAADRG